MLLSLPRSTLVSALSAVKPAARGVTPILANVLIEADSNDTLTLTATDLEIHLRIRVADVSVQSPGRTALRAALLLDILRMLDGPEVQIQCDDNTATAGITCGHARHNLPAASPGNFPADPKLKDTVEFALEDSVFRAMLAETAHATSTEEIHPILCGSLVHVGDGQLHVVACDGRRVAASSTGCDETVKTAMNIPGRTVRELLRLLGGDIEKPHRLSIKTGPAVAQFSFDTIGGGIQMVSKLIDGDYPDCSKLFPKEDMIAALPRAELLRSIDRIALVTDAVNLSFTTGGLHLASHGKRGTDMLGEASDSLMIPAVKAVEGTYNARFLRDTLAAIADDTVECHISPQKIAMFKTRTWRSAIAPLKK